MPPKILAPPETMASQSFYRYRGQDRLSVSVFLGFSLLESERAIEIASALKGAMDSLAPYAPQGVPFDLGLPKPRGEFLAAGEAFAPYGSEERAMAVSFAVGSLRRDFLAMGAQAERGPKPGPPAPFKFQPLSWSATAHCEEWNPIGVKPGEPLAPGGPPIHGPLVTEADYDREGRVTQAAFGPNAPASPLPMANPPGRLKAIGSFGPDWLLTAAPGLPDDFDWDFFNLAQKGQRLPQGYFRGDERVQVANGHSHYPHFDVRLPGYAPRLFVHQKSAPERFLEVRPDLDTVWLFPSASMGLLIWRAQLSVEDELASDVYSVFVGLEKIGQNSLDPRELAEGALNGLWPAIPLAVAVPADPFAPLPEIAPAAPPEEPLEDPAPSAAVPAASPPSPPPVPPAPLASLAAPLALAPAALLDPALTAKAKAASIIGESRKIMTEELPSVNETLREMGLPELTLESLEPHFQSEEARLTKVLENSQMAEAKAPLSPDDAFAGQKDADDDLAESLMAYGIDPERAKGISLAAALPIPQEATFETAGAYELAMKEYGLEWAALMGVSPVDGLKQAKKLKAAALLAGDPTNPAAMSALLGSGPAEALAAANPLAVSEEMAFMEALKPLGLEPKAASDLFQGIEQYDAALSQSSQMALAEREKLSLELGQKLESALGLPAGAATGQMKSNFLDLRRSVYVSESLGLSLAALAGTVPALSPFLTALERVRLNPGLPQTSLVEIAQAAGVDDQAILARLADLDPLNPAPVPNESPSSPAAPAEEPAEEPEPLWEPGPSQTFRSREEVIAALTDPKIARSPAFGAIWPGSAMAGLNLNGLCFAGLDLSGADLAGASLKGASLDGANCQRASFDGASLCGCSAQRASFAGASFIRADLRGLDLSSTLLAEADLAEADLTDSNLEGAMANGANFAGAALPRRLKGASLIEARFEGQDLSEADFSGALLDRAFFEEVDLTRANFSQASLKEAGFYRCAAPKAVFRAVRGQGLRFLPGCDLDLATFRGADLREAVFQDSRLTGVDFAACRALGLRADFQDLAAASLKGAYLREASFFGSNLTGADVSGSDLLGASLGSSDLRGANLSGASLYGADLYRVRLDKKTLLQGADLNDTCLKIESAGLSAV